MAAPPSEVDKEVESQVTVAGRDCNKVAGDMQGGDSGLRDRQLTELETTIKGYDHLPKVRASNADGLNDASEARPCNPPVERPEKATELPSPVKVEAVPSQGSPAGDVTPKGASVSVESPARVNSPLRLPISIIPGHAAKSLSGVSNRAKMSLFIMKPTGTTMDAKRGPSEGPQQTPVTEPVRVNRARKTLPKPTPSQVNGDERAVQPTQGDQSNKVSQNSLPSQVGQPNPSPVNQLKQASPTRQAVSINNGTETPLSVCVAVPAAPRKRKRKMGLYSFGQKKKGKPIRQRTLMEMLQGKVAQPERDGRAEECDRASDGESDRDMADPSGDETQPPLTASGTVAAPTPAAPPRPDTRTEPSRQYNHEEEGEVMDGDTEDDEDEGEESENHSDVSSGSSSKRKRAGGKQKGGNPWVKPNRRRSRVERQKYLQRSGQSDGEKRFPLGSLSLAHPSLPSARHAESRRSSDMEEGLQELPLCSCRMEAPKNREISKLSSGKCMATESTNGQLTRCLRSVAKQETMRPSSRVQLMVVCEEHRAKMMTHHCCPGCGFFCSTGTFLECQPDVGISHRFHVRCVSRLNGSLYCPHCGEEASSAREVTVSAADAAAAAATITGSAAQSAAPPAAAVISASAAPAPAPSGSEGEAPLSEGEVAGPATTLKSGAVISATGLPSAGSKELLEQALITLHTERPKKLRFNPKQLYLASRLGELQKVLLMLVEGLDPNVAIEGQRKRTPMHGAAERGHVEVLHTLVQAGGNIDACDQDQKTPLLQAAESNQLASTRYLVKAGAYVAHKDDEGATCLHLAAKKGNLEVVQYLVSTGKVNINCQDDGGWTPIIWTAEYKHVDVVRLLLSRGADVTLRDNEENICLHWAAFAGSVDIAEEFINAQCDLHAANLHGDTPLHIASRENHYECVVLLLARGANVDVRNKEGETPMECASVDSTVWLALQMNRKLREIVACRPARTERILTRDIARGYENVPIPCVNGVDEEPPPADYKYLAKSCETSPMNIDCNITHLQHCSCGDDCSSSNCLCGQLSIRCWYDKDGRLLPEFNKIEPPLIFECNHSCSCWRSCKNRVVQHGIRVRMQLYRTAKMGWGVRALQDILPGTFICEYVGEIISDAEADVREDDSYLFDLDNKDGEVYCIDARYYGNVSRFINHLCEPNLVPVRVFMSHQDLRFPRIAFFSSRHVLAGEELGFDYGERFWDIKSRYFTCQCGSEKCKHSAEMIARRHAQAEASGLPGLLDGSGVTAATYY
ncbi:unnamed protein product [Lampetra planeri]